MSSKQPPDVELLADFAIALISRTTVIESLNTPDPSRRWTILSPLTFRVVQLLCGEGWLSKDEIAARLNEQPEGKLAPILTDLVERNVLESSPRKGYHIALPEDAEPDTYRRNLVAWLASQATTPAPRPTTRGYRHPEPRRPERPPLPLPHDDNEDLADEEIAARIEAAKSAKARGLA